ncbi:hypothetical protein C7820_6440 [Paenibacillus sp. VMFN-D1]|jgi:hypothetical protein|uniref:Uncharacterized protein n=1 Tax=Paenibacillus favisporus TaxID=221028 RepID=A0ABV2FE56_9BACL|nr:hypothetical protein C7820_6440 [Paenibacillus sp. VMFN-D1]
MLTLVQSIYMQNYMQNLKDQNILLLLVKRRVEFILQNYMVTVSKCQ